MNEVLKQLLTGKDGQTHDIMRWLCLVTCLAALGLEIYVVAVIRTQSFDVQSFGIGMGAVFAAVGAGLKLKEGTEP